MKYLPKWYSKFRFVDADDKNFKLVFFAFLVGLVVGLFGAAFRLALVYIEEFREQLFANAHTDDLISWLWPILFAVLGAGVSLFIVKRYAPETSGSGVHEIEGALDELRPLRWKRVLPIKFFASLFSLGGGFLLGREGPTIQIGANIGKMIRDVFKQSEDKSNPLISAGAAAGLASAFNAPLSGIVFVIEEMHGHFKFSFFSMAAIMIASATADIVVRVLVGGSAVIQMTVFQMPSLSMIWMFILLGFLFSFIGFAFNKLLIWTLDFFGSLKKQGTIVTVIIAGIIIAIVGVFYPSMIGGGYQTISLALDQSYTLQFLLVLFVGRLLLTIFSYGIGLPGGIFAPMLALGVVFGMLFGGVMQYYFPGQIAHPEVFAVAGMAAIFASTVRAPITGLILAVEMTSNFELLLPLIFTAVTASLITTQLGNQPIYTILLRRTLEEKNNNKEESKRRE